MFIQLGKIHAKMFNLKKLVTHYKGIHGKLKENNVKQNYNWRGNNSLKISYIFPLSSQNMREM